MQRIDDNIHNYRLLSESCFDLFVAEIELFLADSPRELRLVITYNKNYRLYTPINQEMFIPLRGYVWLDGIGSLAEESLLETLIKMGIQDVRFIRAGKANAPYLIYARKHH